MIKSAHSEGQNEKESRNIKKAPSNELGVEIEPNTIKIKIVMSNYEKYWMMMKEVAMNKVKMEKTDWPNRIVGRELHLLKIMILPKSTGCNGKLDILQIICYQIAILIYEPENTKAKQFFPLLEEKVLMGEAAQKLASGEREDDEETSDKSSDSDTKSTSCSNSNDEENEEGSGHSKENEFGDSTVFQLMILIPQQPNGHGTPAAQRT